MVPVQALYLKDQDFTPQITARARLHLHARQPVLNQDVPVVLGTNTKMNIKAPAAWLPVIFYAILIFHFSSVPGDDIPQLFPHSDILFHMIEYFPFGFLLILAMKASLVRFGRGTLLFSIFVILLYALSDEIHQLFVPMRTFSVIDILFDCIGSTAGGFSYLWLKSNHS